MSFIHQKLTSLLLCGVGNPHRHPFEGIITHFTHSGSLAQHAAHHGLVIRTRSITAAASSAAVTAAAAGSAAVTAGTAAVTAAVQRGTTLGVRAVWTALVIITTTCVYAVTTGYEQTTMLFTSLPRTFRTACWVIRAGLSYKRFASEHAGEDPDSDAYHEAIGELHAVWAKKLLALCKRNGGVYIKAGQFAAAFGAVPREYRLALSGLEDRATPKPFKKIKVVLQQELGPNARQLFHSFEETATAAASLAQVHKAVLITGEAVAVKVQYPGLAKSIAADLAILKIFNMAATMLFPHYRLAWLVEELDKKLAQELDFRTELLNVRRVAVALTSSRAAEVPVMHDRLCTPRLLVMEWIDGCKVNDKHAMKEKSINPKAVGRRLVKMFGELSLIQGFMHGDPHSGNILVRTKGRKRWWHWLLGGSRQPFDLVLLDHGTYLDINDELRQQLCQLWCSFMLQDKALQSDLCAAVAGERGPTVLPVLLTQTARNRSEERAVRKAAGINGVGDMAALLQTAPREVVEVLRINTVIRATSAQLGLSMDERKRILACYARRGLPQRSDTSDHVHKKFNKLFCRVQLAVMLGAWQGATAVKQVVFRGWSMVLGLWEDVLE